MPKPEVSICIPTYEQTPYLTKLLESLLVQNFHDFEIIITDDSRDNRVADLVKKYQSKFKQKFTFIQNKPIKGLPENWNFAINKAQGKLIKIMHHDDWFTYHDSLASFVTSFYHQPNSIYYSASLNYYPKKDSYYVRSTSPEQLHLISSSPQNLIFHNYIGVPSCTIFQNPKQLRFDPALVWRVDVEFYLQLLLKNSTISYNSRPLVTTSTSAEHNISNDFVQGNPKEIEELLHIYAKLQKNIPIKDHSKLLKFIGYKMIQYRYSPKQMQVATDRLQSIKFPHWLFTLTRLNQVSRLAARAFLKIN